MPDPVLEQKQESRGCRVAYRWTHANGVSVARKAGAIAAQHDLLIFIDDDMIAAADWFASLLPALIRLEGRGVVTGHVAPADGDGSLAPSIRIDLSPALYEGRTERDILYSGNMAVDRVTFIGVGGFDARLGPGTPFPAAEDNDLGFRLLEAGYRIAYVPEAVLYHRAWRTRRDHLTLRWRYGRGQGAFYAKHLDLTDRYMLRRILKDLTVAMRSLAKTNILQPHGTAGELAYMFGLMTGVAGWWWACRDSLPPTIAGEGSREHRPR